MENHLKSNSYNGLTLAYIGDAVFELYIRNYIISLGVSKVNDIHNKVVSYTQAKAQKVFMENLLKQELLNDYEISLYKRGRNQSPSTTRHNVELSTYLEATGFESLIGGLYVDGKIERVEEIMKLVTEGVVQDGKIS